MALHAGRPVALRRSLRSRAKSGDHADGRVDSPACNRPARSYSPAESLGVFKPGKAATPLVLNPGSLYHGSCATLGDLVAAAQAEVALLQLLEGDGWVVDPWATDDFVALRPGPASQWRVAGGASRGRRVLLHRLSSEVEGLAVEWMEGPWG